MDAFIKQITDAVATRSADEFKTSTWNSAMWTCAIAGETGELCNMVKKEFRGDDFPPGVIDGYIQKEVADIFIYLIAFCISRGYDLEKITRDKFNEVSERRGYKTLI